MSRAHALPKVSRPELVRIHRPLVDAGCKVAIRTSLKRAGMHGSVNDANAIIAVRCCKLSGRYEDFWERRAALHCTGCCLSPSLKPDVHARRAPSAPKAAASS